MSKQPEALRLADAFDYAEFDVVEHGQRVAAELRRLHAEKERLTDCLKKANDQAERFEREWYLLGDLNAELVEALQSLLDMDLAYRRGPKVEDAVEKARAALVKAEG